MFSKSVLGVKVSTQNDFIYGELGCLDLKSLRIVNIFEKYLNIYHAYNNVKRFSVVRLNKTHWAYKVREIFTNCFLLRTMKFAL